MRLKYGAYLHDVAEAAVSISKEALLSDNGDVIGRKETWTIEGRKIANSQVLLNTALQSLEAAYSASNKDLVLQLDNGSNSLHTLLNTGSINGVQVLKPVSYPEGANAQFSTFRDYTIVVSASYSSEDENENSSYSETFSYQGTGGPRYVVRETLTGQPVVQNLTQSSVRFLVQQGTAENLMVYPSPSPPVQPNAMAERTTISNSSQSRNGQSVYVTRWSYTYSE